MNDMTNEFREIVERSLKEIKDDGLKLSSGIVLLYSNDDEEEHYTRIVRSTSEDQSRFIQTAIQIAEKAGLDYNGIEEELAHILKCQSIVLDMEDQAMLSLENKLSARKSQVKERKHFNKFLTLMSYYLQHVVAEQYKKAAEAEAANNNRKEGE